MGGDVRRAVSILFEFVEESREGAVAEYLSSYLKPVIGGKHNEDWIDRHFYSQQMARNVGKR